MWPKKRAVKRASTIPVLFDGCQKWSKCIYGVCRRTFSLPALESQSIESPMRALKPSAALDWITDGMAVDSQLHVPS
jgi:hypothetical protein